MDKNIKLTQEEIEVLLVALEHISDTDDDEEFENDYGITMTSVTNIGKKLYNNCNNTNGRFNW